MKRNRAPNFTNAEVMHLFRLVEEYPVIKNKQTDAVTTNEKHSAWKALAEEYNSTSDSGPRTVENLIACYKNQKIKVKKQYSKEKMTIKAPSTQLVCEAVLSHSNAGKKKKTADTFMELAEDKKEYIQIKINMAEEQLVYERKMNNLNIEIMEEKLRNDKERNAMEIDHQQKIKEMELQFLKRKYELELNLLKNK